MKDENKSKKQLIEELTEIRLQVASLMASQGNHTHTKDELRKSAERFRLMADNIQDGLAIVQNNVLVYVNKRLSDIAGYSREELLNLTIFDIIVPEQKEQIMGLYKKFLQSGIVPESTNFDIVQKNGTRRTIQSKHSLSRLGDNEVDHYVIITDITQQKRAEEAVRKHQENLEDLVKHRTAELAEINEYLRKEIDEHTQTETALIKRESELEIKTKNLEELNTALKVLLKRRDEDKEELSEKVLLNVKELVLPYIERIKKIDLSQTQNNYISILESNLNQIISPFLHKLSSRYSNLTPTEIRVANFIKEGKTTKEIAQTLILSKRTIDFYRENIRKKLGLNNIKTNLRTHLLTLQ